MLVIKVVYNFLLMKSPIGDGNRFATEQIKIPDIKFKHTSQFKIDADTRQNVWIANLYYSHSRYVQKFHEGKLIYFLPIFTNEKLIM